MSSNFVLQQRKFRAERPIEVDGEKTALMVDAVFNDKDGTFRVTPRQTLKTSSRNPSTAAAISQQIEAMRSEGVGLMLQLNAEWQVGAADQTPQGDLFNTPKQRYEASADQAMQDEHGVKWNEENERYEYPNGKPFNANESDEDGGPDDEGEPAGNTLDMAAAPRERRPRSNAHLEN